MTDKCWKGTKHDYEQIDKTGTHLIYRCKACKGKKWRTRNNGVRLHKINPVRI